MWWHYQCHPLCPAQRHHPFMGLGQQCPCRARASEEDTAAEMGPWGEQRAVLTMRGHGALILVL